MRGACAKRCGLGGGGGGGLWRGLGKGPKGSKLDFEKMAMKFFGKRIFNGSTSFYETKTQQRQTVPNT